MTKNTRTSANSTAICWLILVGCLISLEAAAAAPQNPGLRRSNSDPGLARSNSGSGQSCSLNYNFDYLQLSLSWPPGACSTSPQQCRKGSNKQFNIHGLWPTKRGTQEPSNCCAESQNFDLRQLRPILGELDQNWYSYYDPNSNRGFWAHEWRKHGTCSRNVPSLRGETSYFGTTLKLAKQLPLLEALSKSGIQPSDDPQRGAYESGDILRALAPLSQNKVVQIECDYELQQPTPILTGINFCFDSQLKPADCPQTWRKCQRKLLFRSSPTRISR